MDKIVLLSVAIILAMFFCSVFFYSSLPAQVATHWNAFGIVDGFSGSFFGAFVLPVLTAVILVFFLLLPKIDPLKKNFESFKKEFSFFILIFVAFFAAIHFFLLAFNLGARCDIRFVVAPGIAVVFFSVGLLMSKAKRNYFVGIRTPWTLASDVVWESTHKIGAKLFYALAVIVLLSLVFPEQFLLLLLVPIIAVTIFLFVFSFFEYKKLEK